MTADWCKFRHRRLLCKWAVVASDVEQQQASGEQAKYIFFSYSSVPGELETYSFPASNKGVPTLSTKRPNWPVPYICPVRISVLYLHQIYVDEVASVCSCWSLHCALQALGRVPRPWPHQNHSGSSHLSFIRKDYIIYLLWTTFVVATKLCWSGEYQECSDWAYRTVLE
jgi:hypothetical protein